eukprot:6214260-Pleurochrysis_carterae.AAC.4
MERAPQAANNTHPISQRRFQTFARGHQIELAPCSSAKTIQKLLRHAKIIQQRIPTWFVARISTESRTWADAEVVAMEDEQEELQFCQITKRKLYQLRVDSSGHGKPISTPWDIEDDALSS